MVVITNEALVMVLIFALVLFLSHKALTKVTGNRAISLIAALSISILSVVYLSYSQFSFIEGAYGLVGTLVLFLIPFIIAFFFIYLSNINGLLRKMFWIFYGIINLLLLQRTTVDQDAVLSITTLIIFLMIILIVFDKGIKNIINARQNLKRRY